VCREKPFFTSAPAKSGARGALPAALDRYGTALTLFRPSIAQSIESLASSMPSMQLDVERQPPQCRRALRARRSELRRTVRIEAE